MSSGTELGKAVARDWPSKMEVDIKASRDVDAGGIRLDTTFSLGSSQNGEKTALLNP